MALKRLPCSANFIDGVIFSVQPLVQRNESWKISCMNTSLYNHQKLLVPQTSAFFKNKWTVLSNYYYRIYTHIFPLNIYSCKSSFTYSVALRLQASSISFTYKAFPSPKIKYRYHFSISTILLVGWRVILSIWENYTLSKHLIKCISATYRH